MNHEKKASYANQLQNVWASKSSSKKINKLTGNEWLLFIISNAGLIKLINRSVNC